MRLKSCVFLRFLEALGLFFVLARLGLAQPEVEGRIAQAIDNTDVSVVKGNVHPMAQPRFDQGAVDPSFSLGRITLMFKPKDSQLANLNTLLEQQQDPSSPNYHQWLTPEQFADRFGLSQNDLDKVVSWLQNQGFTVGETARSRTWVAFSGSAQQVEAVFHTQIHHYMVNGRTYYANASEPSVPRALADVVQGFRSLHNFRPRPRGLRAKTISAAKPNFTSSVSGNHYLAPDDFATIYGVKDLYSAGIDGTRQKIAVMGQTDILMSDIQAFRSASGLPANDPTVVLIPGSPDPGVVNDDIGEADLDLEWAGAVAKNATIIYVNSGTAGGAFDSLQYTIDQNLAPVVSISYGDCEQNFGSLDLRALVTMAQQANSQGMTIVAASGDSGAADCDYSTNPNIVVSVATHGLAVDVPASLPYVTGVGGTRFNEGSGTYWSTANNSSNGSALSYIPEIAWNDTAQDQELSAGGGGKSIDFSKPSWQTGNGVPNDGARDVPDVSFSASVDHDGYLTCSQGNCVNGFRASNNTLTVVGGTSVGVPSFAGIVALINQKMNSAQGNVNPILYALAATSTDAFNDITTGNNQVPCRAGTTDCPNGGVIGYTAGPGYDQATGLGSVNAFHLVTEWSSLSSTTSTTPSFQQEPGLLAQVTVGADGSVWGVNSANQIYAFNSATLSWTQMPGLLTQIAVGPGGVVWGLNAAGQIYRFNTQTRNWDQIPGLLIQLAVGADGDVWGINAQNQVSRFNARTQNWDGIPGSLAKLAVGFDGAVWGIDASNHVYRFNPGTQAMEQVAGTLSQIAVGMDGAVWGINTTNQIYRFNFRTQAFEQIPGALAQIAVGFGGAVWGLNSAGQIYRFNVQTQNWDQIPGSLVQIAVGANGAVWGVNASQQIFQFVQPASPAPALQQVSGNFNQLAAGPDGNVWGINTANQVFAFNLGTQNWDLVPGSFTQIAVGFGGAVWGLNQANQIFRFNPQTQNWDQMPGALVKIAVGPNGIAWGLNSAGQIYQFNPAVQNWNQLPGRLAQIAVGVDGAVWGLNAASQIYRFNGLTQNWDQIPGALTQIGVGSGNATWGINAANQIYRFNSQTQGWDSIPGLLTQIAVGFDGTVWGINAANQVFRFSSSTQGWDSIPGSLTQIAVGADSVVWGIDAANQIYRYH